MQNKVIEELATIGISAGPGGVIVVPAGQGVSITEFDAATGDAIEAYFGTSTEYTFSREDWLIEIAAAKK